MSSAAISLGYPAQSAQVVGRAFRPTVVPDPTPMVYVLDEDAEVREALELLIRREGWRCETFASAEEFLRRSPAGAPNCLLVEVSLTDTDALDLQKRVARERPSTSIIFIAAHIDVVTTVKAVKAGAVGILMKPVSGSPLLSTIQEALERSHTNLAHECELRALLNRYGDLSRREREVMDLVVSGLLNKQVGGELGISERTVKAHRGQVMQKMRADSLAQLVKMAAKLGVAAGQSEKALTALPMGAC
jgi:FixJ family two-component response regulator